jgi:hypothetical protein
MEKWGDFGGGEGGEVNKGAGTEGKYLLCSVNSELFFKSHYRILPKFPLVIGDKAVFCTIPRYQLSDTVPYGTDLYPWANVQSSYLYLQTVVPGSLGR